MTSEYTFSSEKRAEAILLAAQIAHGGQESTVHCGSSHFGGCATMDFIEEYVGGVMVKRHYFRSELQEDSCVFAGMAE